jgi:small subunit ribosomal protein S6
MKTYEFTYLIKPDISKEDINSLQEIIKSFIKEEEGSIARINPPLKKNLAYPIKKNKEAFLADLTFDLKPDKLDSLEKKIKSEKRIIRYLLLKKKLLKKKLRVRATRKPQPKAKVELKEIEKKLEEILGE